MNLDALPWIILFLPLFAAVVITLFTRHNRTWSAGLSIAAVVLGFLLSVLFVWNAGWQPATAEMSASWLSVGDLQVQFGLRLDPLSVLMMLVVTGVAGAIHVYSFGYMRGDSGFSRYFAGLSLFTFSMLGIVLANNFFQLFIFWELVGVSSYLLIGFWYEKASAADAAKKAFLTNRLGDFGFMLGILTVWTALGSLNFGVLQQKLVEDPTLWGPATAGAGLLIFCGALGKSAQFPLHVWLPDAMEGPTPVSALIHAATMVAAGVYMLCRVFFLIQPSGALPAIAFIGGLTSILAALAAVQQDDIKRILAYSTLSQLGYMVMAIGMGGPTPAMFHLITHAFFKALLFLGAGSVILAVHHEQNIWKMGGLRTRMPVTFWTFCFGALALAGLWPWSGFFSKDSILAQALSAHQYGYFALGLGIAFLTTFYIGRLLLVVFLGSSRSAACEHALEAPPVMAWPLRLLAVLSLVGGWIGIESVLLKAFPGQSPEQVAGFSQQLTAPFQHAPAAAWSGILVFALGALAAWRVYAGTTSDPLPAKLGSFSRAMRNAFYFDDFYAATVIRFHDFLAAIADWFERWIIAGLAVRGAHGSTELAGRALRRLQTGNLQTYAFLFALGVAVMLYWALGK
jgi:NADH-quinone oxidoreductase subunit L